MGKVQKGHTNVAGNGDRIDVQVGQVGGRAEKAPKPAKGDEVRVTNVRSGSARVGRQVDEVHGDINIGETGR